MVARKPFRFAFLAAAFGLFAVLALLTFSSSVQAGALSAKPIQLEAVDTVSPNGALAVEDLTISPKQIGAPQTCTLAGPALLDPENGVQIETLIPYYYWTQLGDDVFRYRVEVSRLADFTSIDSVAIFLVSDPSTGSSARAFSRENLLPDTLYYWRVAGICASGEHGEFSEVFSLTSAPDGGPRLPPPAPITPADGASVGSTRVVFNYSAVSGAESYNIRFFQSAADAWADWHSWVGPKNTMTAKTFGPEETVYWRVASVTSYAIGDPSTLRSFTTPPVFTQTVISPESGGTLSPDPGNISIQFPPGAVDETTTISCTMHALPTQDDAGFRFGGRGFSLEAADAQGPVTTFNEPFSMTVKYDSTDLVYAGIDDPSKLNLSFWNGLNWENVLPCTGCSNDTGNSTITVVIDHVTEFALLAPGEVFVFLPMMIR